MGCAALTLSGCGISSDDGPRDITGQARQELLVVTAGAGAAAGTARIYLVIPGQAGAPLRLRSVPRDVDETATELLNALLAGPNPGEQRQQLTTAIPPGTTVNAVRLRGGVLSVDVAGTLEALNPEAQVAAVAQIVLTTSGVAGVQSVEITENGEAVEWQDGTGELRRGPLTAFDFPGLVESAQPDFPQAASGG